VHVYSWGPSTEFILWQCMVTTKNHSHGLHMETGDGNFGFWGPSAWMGCSSTHRIHRLELC